MVKQPETVEIAIASIRRDGGTQPRDKIDDQVVQDFTAAMKGGAVFPPVVVFFDGTDHWLADGFHRLRAFEAAGINTALCEFRNGTLQEAKAFAAGANQTHGVRRSNEDKARAVMLALEVMADKSDKEIARHDGVGCDLVSKHRAEMGASIGNDRCDPELGAGGVSQPPVIEDPKEPTRVVTRGGKTYPMKVKKIGKSGKPKRDTSFKGIAPGKHEFHPATVHSAPVVLHIPENAREAAGVLLQHMGRIFVEALYFELKTILEQNGNTKGTRP
jgi:hypothetical protein